MKKKELTKSLRYFFGAGDFCFNTMTNIETYFFMFFLTDVAHFDAVTYGIISTVTSTIDACLSWLYGAIINSVKPMKFGRYRSWYVATMWLVPFLYTFQYLKIGSGALSAVLIIVGFVLSHICWNFGYVANVSMIAVCGKTPEDRMALTSMRGTYNNFSACMVAFTVSGLAGVYAKIVGADYRFAALAFTWGAMAALGMFFHFKLTEGYEETGAQELAKPKEKQVERTSILDLLKALFTNAPLLFLMVADLARWLFKFVVGGTTAYYYTYVANRPDLISTHLLIANILGVVGAYLSRYIANKFSTRTGTIIIYLVMAASLLIGKFMYATASVWTIMVLLSISQFCYGAVYAMVTALYADAVVYAHWKTGKNPSGWIMGIQNLPLKIGVMGRSIIISLALGGSGFVGGMSQSQVTPKILNAITNALMTIPAIALILGAILILVGFRITKEKVIQYQKEIDERENAA